MSHPAAEIVRQANEELRAAVVTDNSELGGRRDLDAFPAEALQHAMKLLAEAEDRLLQDPMDLTTVSEGMRRIQEASDLIEATRGFVRWMPDEVVYARADALRLLDRITGRS